MFFIDRTEGGRVAFTSEGMKVSFPFFLLLHLPPKTLSPSSCGESRGGGERKGKGVERKGLK